MSEPEHRIVPSREVEAHPFRSLLAGDYVGPREVVQLSLRPGNLELLLEGTLATSLRLTHVEEDGEGVYRLEAKVPDPSDTDPRAESTRGLLRYLNGTEEGLGPATEGEARQREGWRAVCEKLPGGPETAE